MQCVVIVLYMSRILLLLPSMHHITALNIHGSMITLRGALKLKRAVASALEIETSIAGPVVLQETINVFGQITANPEAVSNISARFAGVIKSVSASIGDTVRKRTNTGDVESNESLKLYSIKAPISGVLTQRNANPGEQTGDRQLFTVTDTSTVWVELSIFPADRQTRTYWCSR